MADETQVTETAPAEEKKGGGTSKFVGAVAGGAGLFTLADNQVANKGIKKVINPEAVKDTAKVGEAKEPQFKKMVDKVTKGDSAKSKAAKEALNAFNAAKDINPAEVTKIVVGEAKDGLTKLTVHSGDAVKELNVSSKSLGKEFTAGAHEGKEALQKLFKDEAAYKGMVGKLETSATKSIRKADGFFAGIKNANGGGKAAIIGATIVGAVVGAKVFHAIFGGKHANKVKDEQPQAEVAPAR